MPRKQHNELLAGTVVLAAIAAALGVVVWLGASDVLRKPAQKAVLFHKWSDGNTGLTIGSPVYLADLKIGKISDIRLDAPAQRTLFYAQIDLPAAQLRSDARVRVAAGFLGGNALVVRSLGAAPTPADETGPLPIELSGLDAVQADLAAASKQLADSLAGELNLASDASALHKIHRMLDGLAMSVSNVANATGAIAAQTDLNPGTLLGKLHKGMDDVVAIAASIAAQTDVSNKEAILARVRSAADDLAQMTAENKPKIDQTLSAVSGMALDMQNYTKKDVAELLAGLRGVSGKVLAVASDLQTISQQAKEVILVNRDRIDETVDNLTQVSADLKSTAKEVRRAPWRLLYTPKPGEVHSQNIYDAARAFSSGAEQLDQALAKLSGLAKAHPQGLPADDPEVAKIRKQVEESFNNFSKAEQSLWKELSAAP
jgi:ABC-type transporter Mla subunit MlaD